MGAQAPPPTKRRSPPIFGPYMLRPNGNMDQAVTWYGARPRPRRLCVRWGPRYPSQKGGGAPKFSAHVYCGQRARWIKMPLGTKVGLSPGDSVLDRDPVPYPKRGGAPPPIFDPCLFWPNGCIDQDSARYGCRCRPTRHCVRWGPSSVSPKRVQSTIFGHCPLWPNDWMD